MPVVPNPFVRGFGVTPNGMPSGMDFYTPGGGGGGGGVTSQEYVASGATHTTTSVDTFVGWLSSTASSKTETIPTSTGSLGIMIINDLAGTANTYNINVAPVTGAIIGPTAIKTNFGSITLLDTNAGWVVTSLQTVAGSSPGDFLTTEGGDPITTEAGGKIIVT